MKNVRRISMLVGFLLSCVYTNASESLGVKVMDNQNLVVELESVEDGVILLLQDEDGEILFRQNIMAGDFYKKIFHLEVLPIGTYFLSLEYEHGIQSTVLVKNKRGLEIKEDISGIIFKPVYQIEKDKVNFFLTNPKGNKIRVTVYDENEVEVGIISSLDTTIHKTFDFSGVPPGKYFLLIETKDRNFTKEIIVD